MGNALLLASFSKILTKLSAWYETFCTKAAFTGLSGGEASYKEWTTFWSSRDEVLV